MKLNSRFLSLLLALPLLFLFVSCEDDEDLNPTSPSKNHRPLTDRLQWELDRMVKDEYKMVGALLGVKFADDGELWVGASGHSNLNFDVDLYWNDRSKIGSITKTYTAAVILQLVDAGLMSLDANALTYLVPNHNDSTAAAAGDPSRFDYWETIAGMMPQHPDTVITVRSLLNHTSGLVNYTNTNAFHLTYYANPYKQWSQLELLSLTTDGLMSKPGTEWAYSNTGYIYLGLMIEHITGNPLEQEFQTRIFRPIGLNATEFLIRENPPDLIDGYLDFTQNGVIEPYEEVTGVSPTIAWSAGSMVSNIPDMIKYWEATMNHQLYSPAMQTEREKTVVFHPVPGDPSIEAWFGLGMVKLAEGIWGHQGSIEGYTSSLFKDPAGNYIAVLVTGSYGTGQMYANDILMQVINILNPAPSPSPAKTYMPDNSPF